VLQCPDYKNLPSKQGPIAYDSVQTVAVFGRLRRPVYLGTRAGFSFLQFGRHLFYSHPPDENEKFRETIRSAFSKLLPSSVYFSISPSSHPELIMCNN